MGVGTAVARKQYGITPATAAVKDIHLTRDSGIYEEANNCFCHVKMHPIRHYSLQSAAQAYIKITNSKLADCVG